MTNWPEAVTGLGAILAWPAAHDASGTVVVVVGAVVVVVVVACSVVVVVEAGWLVGIFFAAYVPAVPVLLALTDRLPARRIYLLGTALTALSHFGFATLADGFWSGFVMRALAGIAGKRDAEEPA